MTPIRKGSNPVKIPFAIKSSDRTFAAWANEIRTAIRQLEARVPTANIGRTGTSAGYVHPFKIRVTGGEVFVSYGMVSIMRVFADSASDYYPSPEYASVLIDGAAMENDPDGGTVGSITVADGTYGVWIELSWAQPGPFEVGGGGPTGLDGWYYMTYSLSASIITSSVATGATASILPGTAAKSYMFIGRVVVTGGEGVVSQYLRSDVLIPGSIVGQP